MPSGIILKGIGGFYYVLSENKTYECKARGIFRKNEITPLPGDRVDFSVIDEDKKTGSLDGIMPRTSLLTRPAVANVNQVAIVIAVKSPPLDFMLLDKLLVTAARENIKPVICLNKLDLDGGNEHSEIEETYRNAGYSFILTSNRTGEGLDELESILKSNITVFAGQSGVGKSTLLNSIMKNLVMQTGGLSQKTDRGKHTTRHAELVPLECGGFVVDTPGFSSFELEDIDKDELQLYFPEFGGLAGECRFAGCCHIKEPDCKVKDSVSSGLIDTGRYDRYVELFGYLKQLSDNKYKKTYREKKK